MHTICSEYHFFLFLIIIFFLSPEASHAADTIDISQILRDNDTSTLISSGGSFELGFFSPQNSKNRYVGIWYKKMASGTVVWVANRDSPLMDRSGTLRVVEAGRLVLVNATNDIIWSTNASRTVKNPVARLLDSGNLVVKDEDDNKQENFLWQSFNYPTDTLLPGMKLGWNFVTGLEVYLESPRSNDDLSVGDYSCHLDPSGYPEQVIKKGSDVKYRTGPWNGVTFGLNSNLQRNNIFSYEVVMNENEVYYHDQQLNESIITRFTLSENGLGRRWVWVNRTQEWSIYVTLPLDNCDFYNGCGPNSRCNTENYPVCGCLNKFKPKDPQGWDRGDWSSGCARRTELNCQKGDTFLKYTNVKLPDTRRSWFNKSMTLEECRALCSKNCSCTAYASLDVSRGERGCLLWFDDLVDIRKITPGQVIFIRMASSESDSERKKRTRLAVTLSLVIGMILLILMLFLSLRKRKKLDHHVQETGRPRLNFVDNHSEKSHNRDLELPQFDLSTIVDATDNFSFNNKLGEGGFGPVYKGLLEEGQEIAVKCLSSSSHQGVHEFKNEVICIAKLQHRNLVKLLGWCIHGEEMMLVYEYMTNRSLDIILFDPMKSILLDWPRRFNIINGIARGLMYLHQDSRLRVIHRDLKASNVLLDSDMNPKISDFGLARTLEGNETGAGTSRIVGTYGYMSPEYAVDGLFSVKSDVFSYGVLVLEIVSGTRNRAFTHPDHSLNLLGHAWMLYKEERSLELVDSSLRNSCNVSKIVQSINIGLLCVQENPGDRPTMSSVVQMLSNDSVLPEAKHPGFFTSRNILNTETPVSTITTKSNTMSITLLEAR